MSSKRVTVSNWYIVSNWAVPVSNSRDKEGERAKKVNDRDGKKESSLLAQRC